jgi:hypothetical protein
LHNNTPFINSSFGKDQIIPVDGDVFKIIEQIDDSDSNTTISQSIDTITHGALSLTLFGQLSFSKSSTAPIRYQLTFTEKNENHLEFDIKLFDIADSNRHRILFNYASLPNEDFYGFGEQFLFNFKKSKGPHFCM